MFYWYESADPQSQEQPRILLSYCSTIPEVVTQDGPRQLMLQPVGKERGEGGSFLP